MAWYMWTRKKGSTRPSRSKLVEFQPNFAGQGGYPFLTLFSDGRYIVLEPETIEDVRSLQSQAGILALTVDDKKA